MGGDEDDCSKRPKSGIRPPGHAEEIRPPSNSCSSTDADRRGLRYESDLTDAEWALVAPLIVRPSAGGDRSANRSTLRLKLCTNPANGLAMPPGSAAGDEPGQPPKQ